MTFAEKGLKKMPSRKIVEKMFKTIKNKNKGLKNGLNKWPSQKKNKQTNKQNKTKQQKTKERKKTERKKTKTIRKMSKKWHEKMSKKKEEGLKTKKVSRQSF